MTRFQIDDKVTEITLYAFEGMVKEIVRDLEVSEVGRDWFTINTGRMKYDDLGVVVHFPGLHYKCVCRPTEVVVATASVRTAVLDALAARMELDKKAFTDLRALCLGPMS